MTTPPAPTTDPLPPPTVEEITLMHNNICKALGDVKRILIMYALAERPLCVGELAEKLDAPQPTVSRHLAVLRSSRLVTTERDGTNVIYHLAEPRIITVMDIMRHVLRDALQRQTSALE